MKKLFGVFMLLLSVFSCNRGALRSESGNVAHAAEPQAAKWFKNEIPLTVHVSVDPAIPRIGYGGHGSASANGFWQSTSTEKGKQLVWPIAVKIECDREAKVCRETDATVQLGFLQPDEVEYEISSWSEHGIVADDADECNRRSLAIDFKTNSVTVTDYPIKKVQGDSDCKPLHEAYSYALHGGQLQLYPPAPWNPLGKRE